MLKLRRLAAQKRPKTVEISAAALYDEMTLRVSQFIFFIRPERYNGRVLAVAGLSIKKAS